MVVLLQLFTALIIQVSSSHYLIIFHCNNVSLSRKQCNYGCNLLSHIADENNVIIVLGYHNLLDLSFGNCQLHSFLSFVNWLPFVLLETLYFLLLLFVNSLQLFSFPAISVRRVLKDLWSEIIPASRHLWRVLPRKWRHKRFGQKNEFCSISSLRTWVIFARNMFEWDEDEWPAISCFESILSGLLLMKLWRKFVWVNLIFLSLCLERIEWNQIIDKIGERDRDWLE